MSKIKITSGENFQNNRLEEILDRISDAFVALDKNWCYTYMNKKAGEIFNRDPVAIVGKHIWTEFPEGVDQPFKKGYEKAMNEQKYVYLEEYYSPYDKWFENHIYPSVDGLTVYFRDINEKKKAEQDMNKVRGENETLINHTSDFLWSVRNDYTLIAANMAFVNALKENGEYLIKSGDNLLSPEHYPDDYLQYWKGFYDKALSGKKVQTEVYIPQVGNDELLWFELKIDHIIIDNKIDGIACSMRNITERKKAEKRLIEQENQLRLFIENSPVSLVMLDKDMKYLQVSNKWKHDFNIKNENLVGKSHYEIFPEIPEHWKEVHNRCLAGATEKKEEDIFIRADGSIEWILWEVHPWYKTQDEVGGIIIFSENITERKKAETKVAESENRLRTILDTEPECVKLLNQKGEIIEMNPAGLAMIEAESLDQVKGQSVLNIIIKTYQKSFSELTKNVFLGKPGNLEFEITGLKGTRRWLETHAVPLNNSNGTIGSLLGVTRDITGRKKAEEKIFQLNQELELKVKERTQELEIANADLKEGNDLFLGREARIIELKEELEKLKYKLPS